MKLFTRRFLPCSQKPTKSSILCQNIPVHILTFYSYRRYIHFNIILQCTLVSSMWSLDVFQRTSRSIGWLSCFVFVKSRVRISTCRAVKLSDVLCDTPQSSAGVMLQKGHYRVFLRFSQFIIRNHTTVLRYITCAVDMASLNNPRLNQSLIYPSQNVVCRCVFNCLHTFYTSRPSSM
jgi:hypothetical protein